MMDKREWRVLLVSLELAGPVFSGNGVLATAVVRVLRQGGAALLALCGMPEGASAPLDQTLLTVPLPRWEKLDKDSAWEAFAAGAAQHAKVVAEFHPDVVLAVDWTSTAAVASLRRAGTLHDAPTLFLCFRVFAVSDSVSETDAAFYRRQERAALLAAHVPAALSAHDARLLSALANPPPRVEVLRPPLRLEMKELAQRRAWLGLKRARQMALHREASTRMLREAAREACGNGDTTSAAPGPRRSLPSLSENGRASSTAVDESLEFNNKSIQTERQELLRRTDSSGALDFASNLKGNFLREDKLQVQHGFGGPRPVALSHMRSQKNEMSARRKYITCCCRITPEKNVLRFVETMIAIKPFLLAHGFVPCLVGPPTNEKFANAIYKQLDRAFPNKQARILREFVSAKELSGIFSETVLNFHPAVYEAYGMTIIEAAVFGAPTLMHQGDLVGAGDLLPAPHRSIRTDMHSTKACTAVLRSVLHPSKADLLECIGEAASRAALSWGDEEFGRRVFELMELTLEKRYKIPSVEQRNQNEEEREVEALDDVRIKILDIPEEERSLWKGMHEWILGCAALNGFRPDLKVVNVKYIAELEVDRDWELLAEAVEKEYFRLLDIEAESLYLLNGLTHNNDKSKIRFEARKPLREKLEKSKPQEFTTWAKYFMKANGLHFQSVSKARYRLVPGKLPEVAFWTIVFSFIKARVLKANRN